VFIYHRELGIYTLEETFVQIKDLLFSFVCFLSFNVIWSSSPVCYYKLNCAETLLSSETEILTPLIKSRLDYAVPRSISELEEGSII